MWLVGNRIHNDEDVRFLEQEASDLPLLGYLPEDPGVVDADRRGESVYALVPPLREAAARIADALSESMPVPSP
jgi:CO dehydrogenase nickel-insertion accessory protein CooC1